MKLAVMQALAVGWLLGCLIEPLCGSPQRPYWISSEESTARNHRGVENRFPMKIDHGNLQHRGGYGDSPYESIDQFQLEQRRSGFVQDDPGQFQIRYGYEDDNFSQIRKEQESYYQNLLRATESPPRELQNQESSAGNTAADERQIYYQDYLPLDENEGPNFAKFDQKAKPVNILNSIDENVKNSTNGRIAELVSNLLLKEDSYGSNSNDLEAISSLEDDMIAEASIPEGIKRGVRQVRGQQPGLLLTLAKLTFEKVNDTKSAVNQIGKIVNDNFAPESASTSRPTTSTTTTTTTSNSVIDGGSTSSTINADSTSATTTTTTTTEAPFMLTRTELQGIIRRNLRGLIRLFNIEWRDALNQSQVSVREFQRDLGNQVRPYFEPNPNLN